MKITVEGIEYEPSSPLDSIVLEVFEDILEKAKEKNLSIVGDEKYRPIHNAVHAPKRNQSIYGEKGVVEFTVYIPSDTSRERDLVGAYYTAKIYFGLLTHLSDEKRDRLTVGFILNRNMPEIVNETVFRQYLEMNSNYLLSLENSQ